MCRRSFLPVVLLAVMALAACGSGSSKAGSTSTTNAVKLSSPDWETAKPYPSVTAKMICQAEVRGEIADALEITEKRVVPTWNKKAHLYSCTYVYPHGKIVLTVKELSNQRETTAYVEAVQTKYGSKNPVHGFVQGAWLLKNDDVVVRKDYKVLLVDVRGIAPNFIQGLQRSEVATSIANIIMECWPGA